MTKLHRSEFERLTLRTNSNENLIWYSIPARVIQVILFSSSSGFTLPFYDFIEDVRVSGKKYTYYNDCVLQQRKIFTLHCQLQLTITKPLHIEGIK